MRKIVRKLFGKNTHPSAAIIDSQTVRSNPHRGEVGYDAGKMTKGRKRFICVDNLGYLFALSIVPANIPERAGARPLPEAALRRHWLQWNWADVGFSDRI